MPDIVMVSIITGGFALAGAVFTGLIQLVKLNTKADKIHILVNSSMSAQLKINAVTLRRIALITKEEGDDEAADAAAILFQEHETKQAAIDTKSA